jgi:DNA-binding winged helix-turn-helix (wHTH) protein
MKTFPVDLRACGNARPAVVSFGRCELRLDSQELLVEGRPCNPGPLLTRLLMHFLNNPDRTVGREELLEAVWLGRWVRQDVVSSAVMKLRRIISPHAGDDLIWTVHGQGYRFVAAVRAGTNPPQERAPDSVSS